MNWSSQHLALLQVSMNLFIYNVRAYVFVCVHTLVCICVLAYTCLYVLVCAHARACMFDTSMSFLIFLRNTRS